VTAGPNPEGEGRLREEHAEVARLLDQASREFRCGESEGTAFRRLERARISRAAWRWGLMAAGLSLGVLALKSRLVSEDESWALVEKETVVVATAPRVEPPRAPAAVAERVVVPETAKAPSQPPVRTAPADEATCQRLSRAGELPGAVECYRSLARAGGVLGELGLYRAAKLELENRGRAASALSLLDEHQARFESGALRGEVAWLRVQALARAGRVDEALGESERLLGGPFGRALAADLHLLRGRLYQDQKRDCALAVQEFVGLMGDPSARGEDAEFRRAGCLEALGRTSDAKAAYEQYLRRQNAPRRTEAMKRLGSIVGPSADGGAQ
jgi:tetratricopeptide (TPR) repeat protein